MSFLRMSLSEQVRTHCVAQFAFHAAHNSCDRKLSLFRKGETRRTLSISVKHRDASLLTGVMRALACKFRANLSLHVSQNVRN